MLGSQSIKTIITRTDLRFHSFSLSASEQQAFVLEESFLYIPFSALRCLCPNCTPCLAGEYHALTLSSFLPIPKECRNTEVYNSL